MQYRRFGRTELRMPVFTCGGMRYQQSWQDLTPAEINGESQANLESAVRRAVSNGITHIETARGYGSSEVQLGRFLPDFPRDQILVQTKIGPKESAEAFLKVFDQSLGNLRLDYVDLLSVHGINTPALLQQTLHDGTLAACRKLQAEGRARHIGFSTHGPTDLILDAIASGAFAYVNLHWYYFDQQHWPAIEAARRADMGVFIISPNDKGGKLYAPPARLSDLCAPWHPMTFNALFCLAHPDVHTLSLGLARPSDLDIHLETLKHLDQAAEIAQTVAARLQTRIAATLGSDWAAHWQEGLPITANLPAEIPLYHILRLYTLAKAFDMLEYGQMRYNLLGQADHWFPGDKLDHMNPQLLSQVVKDYRFAEKLPAMLAEAHALFAAQAQPRLSLSGT